MRTVLGFGRLLHRLVCFLLVCSLGMQIRTNDPKLIRRLASLSEEYSDLCRYIGKDEICGSYFEVDKKRISIQVTRTYSDERRRKQSEWAKEHGLKGNQRQN